MIRDNDNQTGLAPVEPQKRGKGNKLARSQQQAQQQQQQSQQSHAGVRNVERDAHELLSAHASFRDEQAQAIAASMADIDGATIHRAIDYYVEASGYAPDNSEFFRQLYSRPTTFNPESIAAEAEQVA